MISLTLCPVEILKAFLKSHSFSSPHGLWHHLGAIRVSKHGHPVPEHIQGTRGGPADRAPPPAGAGHEGWPWWHLRIRAKHLRCCSYHFFVIQS